MKVMTWNSKVQVEQREPVSVEKVEAKLDTEVSKTIYWCDTKGREKFNVVDRKTQKQIYHQTLYHIVDTFCKAIGTLHALE